MLEEISATQLGEMLERGQVSSVELVRWYLNRIEAIDRSGPTLNSVLEINPDAQTSALALDQERADGKVRGPLHGIPLLVKDNIDTADQMQTTAGSLALAGRPAGRDAFVVRQLRQAGAIILGKTNLSEWANFRSTHSTSGWSGRGGQTKNPYVLNRNPSGSSSGSGVAVSANLVAGALGTETDGSIVSPAGVSGVVGLKPTVGLVSRTGVIPISHHQDVVGPMTRTVADAALILSAIAGHDRDDSTTQAAAEHRHDYTRYLDPAGLRGARLGIIRDLGFGKSPKEDAVANAAVREMERLGAVLIDLELPMVSEWPSGSDEFTVLLYDFKHDLNRYLQGRGPTASVHSLEDVIQFNDEHAAQELCYFDQDILLMAQEKGDLTTPEYQQALAKGLRTSREEGIDALVAENQLDALVAPTNAPAWLIDLVNGDHLISGSSTPAAVAGYPAITVPAGLTSELPIGLTFFGRAWSEPTLLKLAYAFEQHTNARRQPKFLASVP